MRSSQCDSNKVNDMAWIFAAQTSTAALTIISSWYSALHRSLSQVIAGNLCVSVFLAEVRAASLWVQSFSPPLTSTFLASFCDRVTSQFQASLSSFCFVTRGEWRTSTSIGKVTHSEYSLWYAARSIRWGKSEVYRGVSAIFSDDFVIVSPACG